jgi:NAD(P)-dependent dehydrogenase (short-subunit alcohol dehydrogenase family)
MLIEKHLKTALVVGAGSGIGSAVVDRLAHSRDIGCVVAASRRPVSSLDRKVRWRQLEVVDAAPGEITEQLTRACDRVDLLSWRWACCMTASWRWRNLCARSTRESRSGFFAVNAAAPLGLLTRVPAASHPSTAICCLRAIRASR